MAVLSGVRLLSPASTGPSLECPSILVGCSTTVPRCRRTCLLAGLAECSQCTPRNKNQLAVGLALIDHLFGALLRLRASQTRYISKDFCFSVPKGGPEFSRAKRLFSTSNETSGPRSYCCLEAPQRSLSRRDHSPSFARSFVALNQTSACFVGQEEIQTTFVRRADKADLFHILDDFVKATNGDSVDLFVYEVVQTKTGTSNVV